MSQFLSGVVVGLVSGIVLCGLITRLMVLRYFALFNVRMTDAQEATVNLLHNQAAMRPNKGRDMFSAPLPESKYGGSSIGSPSGGT